MDQQALTVVQPQGQTAPFNPQQLRDSLPAFRGRYINTAVEAEQTRQAIAALSVPASPDFIAARVVSLLVEYYVGDIPATARQSAASVWLRELQEFPEWVIDDACAWWVGRHNKKRGIRPKPGDIAEQCLAVMGSVRNAASMLSSFEKYGPPERGNVPEFLRLTVDG